MDTYALHLAMAALVGASVVAVSAYYVHRKTLTQLLEFARSIERDRDEDGKNPNKRSRKHNSSIKRGGGGYSCNNRDGVTEEEEEDGVERVVLNGEMVELGFPAGLPRLHTVVEGTTHSYMLDRFLSELIVD